MLYNIAMFRHLVKQSAAMPAKTPILYIVKVIFSQMVMVDDSDHATIVLGINKIKERLRMCVVYQVVESIIIWVSRMHRSFSLISWRL